MTALILILLHAPDGHEVTLNATAVVSMHAAIPDQPNKVFTDEAKCVVNTIDGKFFSTRETCETIRYLIEAKK
jgi:hypothetical protein